MSQPQKLKQLVVAEFSSPAVVEKYAKEATQELWASEEILIDEYFKSGSSILDLGCGTGRTIIGVDLTPRFVAIAKIIAAEQGKTINYQEGDATNLHFNEASFNNVLFSFNGWTMIPSETERLNALQEIWRVLMPGGHFIFTTHKRIWHGYFWLWFKQGIRIYILKPLGFKIDEIEFGDVFFKRDSSAPYLTKQFIHIPNVNRVKMQLEQIGFLVVLMKLRNEIVDRDKKLPSRDCMFYVCQKPFV